SSPDAPHAANDELVAATMLALVSTALPCPVLGLYDVKASSSATVTVVPSAMREPGVQAARPNTSRVAIATADRRFTAGRRFRTGLPSNRRQCYPPDADPSSRVGTGGQRGQAPRVRPAPGIASSSSRV